MPQRLADRIIWQSVFGASSEPPRAGPNASPLERARATGAMRLLRQGKSARRWLLRGGEDDSEELRGSTAASLLAFGSGISLEEAEERLERMEGEEER